MKKILTIFTILAAVVLTASCQKELPDAVKNIDMSQGGQTSNPKQVEKYVRASAESLSFTSPAGSLSFTITSNTSWSIKSDQDWCMVSSSSGSNNATLTVNVSENTSTSSRSATIAISSTDAGSVKVSITQAGANPDLQLNKNDLSFTADAGSDSFTITSNTNWTAESSRSWCTLSSSSGSGNGTVTVRVSENTSTDSRTASVTVKAGDVTQTIAITQSGATPVDQSTRTFTANGVSFKMIRVDGGTFMMGATSEQGSDAESDEKPAHQVTLSTYYMGETEVTQELWQALMDSNPSAVGQYPVTYVSWDDCQEFITRLNNHTGQNFRLPTEAEWEFAARGGNKRRGYKYSGSNEIDAVAWFVRNSGDFWLSHITLEDDIKDNNCDIHKVATKSPNELGLYDMSGNVREWCQDWYGSYISNSQTNPTGPSSGSYRVYRGGSWYDLEDHCRVSDRNSSYRVSSSRYLGLRLAL